MTILGCPGPRWVYSALLLRRLLASPHVGVERLLDEQQPDIVLHPCALNGALMDDLLLACRRRSTTTVVLMNSWDNPSTKNVTYIPPDWLLVWGEQTRQHAIDYMGLPPERVVPLGAAQLEFLRRADIATMRASFRADYGLPPAALVILYAASTVCSWDLDALCALDDAIAHGRLPPATIVYRAYPGMEAGELDRIRAREWRHVAIQRDEASRSDVRGADLRRSREESKLGALAAADAVISPLSTILLEAAMLGRPVLCYWRQAELPPKSEFRRGNAPFVHFDDFFAIPEVVVAERADLLVPATRTLLERLAEPGIAGRLRAACQHFVAEDPSHYADRLADFVGSILTVRTPARPGLVRSPAEGERRS